MSGSLSIAYQVVGEGPLDLVVVPGWVSHVEVAWQHPLLARFLERLASFARVIVFDKRGTGLSDRVPIEQLPTLEQRMDDVRAVMDAAGSRQAALFGISEGGPLCAMFAASHPERTAALVVYGSYARRLRATDYPWGPDAGEREQFFKAITEGWGGPVDLAALAPSLARDPGFAEWWATYLRMGASPGAAVALARMNSAVDIRSVLPAISVPTLVVHRRDDVGMQVGGGRFFAEQIPGARFVELAGIDHLPWVGDQDAILDEVEDFLVGTRTRPATDRVLATVLFTDIVDSTATAARMGDARWRALIEAHDAAVRRCLATYQGRLVKSTGDGVLATFDGPGRAIRGAMAIIRAVLPLGIEVRAGMHCGECELIADDIGGISVNIAARVAALAAANEVLVSRTVRDLVAGSGLQFESRGEHELKGVPDRWELFAVDTETEA